jgi:hypothetical protein
MKRVTDLEEYRKSRKTINLAECGKEGLLVDWADFPVIRNAYIQRTLTVRMEQRPREDYIGLRLGLTNCIPEWHQVLHMQKDLVRVGDWMRLV